LKQLDKKELGYALESQVALSQLLMASLALLSSDGLTIRLSFIDEKTMDYRIEISNLLKDMKVARINEYDHSAQYHFPLEGVAKLLEIGNPDRDKTIEFFINVAIQVPLVRVYEFVKSYCEKTNQEKEFKNQDWFKVARAIRNCFCHDFILNVKYVSQRKKLPFTWKNITITEEMLGRPLKYSDITIKEFFDLFWTMIAFGQQLIKRS
jgi:hypothetical protein